MEDDVGIRKLLKFIFVKNFRITREMRASDSSFPACMLRNHFPQKLQYVLFVSNVIVYLKWIWNFDTLTRDLLDSDETYLLCIMYNCFIEHYSQENIFDSFINVCGFVRFFSHETFLRRDNEYDDFNFHIVMEFYESILKEYFIKNGGFQHFVDHILNHDYLSWKFETTDLTFVHDPSTPLHVETSKKLKKELNRADQTLNLADFDTYTLNVIANSMVERVLSTTSSLSPTFSNDQDADETSRQLVKDKIVKGIATFEAVEPLDKDERKCLNLNSKADHIPKSKKDNTDYESIILAVLKHNQSSFPVTSENDILQEAETILEHLKNTIKFLIYLLDENDEMCLGNFT